MRENESAARTTAIRARTDVYSALNLGSIMPVPKDLLEILACPLCREEVNLTEDGEGLKCVKCGRVYPIRDDIPIMLVEEATIDDQSHQLMTPSVISPQQ